MQSLESNPTRCRVVAQKGVPEEIRQLLYGDKQHAYRILFTIRNDTVLILHILHAARNHP